MAYGDLGESGSRGYMCLGLGVSFAGGPELTQVVFTDNLLLQSRKRQKQN
jgi:hypothetical protein